MIVKIHRFSLQYFSSLLHLDANTQVLSCFVNLLIINNLSFMCDRFRPERYHFMLPFSLNCFLKGYV